MDEQEEVNEFIDDMNKEVNEKIVQEEREKTEAHIKYRTRLKTEIAQNMSEDFLKKIGEEMIPYQDVVIPPDMADITVGVMSGVAIEQLKIFAQNNPNKPSFMILRRAWMKALTGMFEIIKAMAFEDIKLDDLADGNGEPENWSEQAERGEMEGE